MFEESDQNPILEEEKKREKKKEIVDVKSLFWLFAVIAAAAVISLFRLLCFSFPFHLHSIQTNKQKLTSLSPLNGSSSSSIAIYC